MFRGAVFFRTRCSCDLLVDDSYSNTRQTYSVSQKIPPAVFRHFPQRLGIFNKFFTPIMRSYLCYITNVYSVISNFDEVMPY